MDFDFITFLGDAGSVVLRCKSGFEPEIFGMVEDEEEDEWRGLSLFQIFITGGSI